MLRAVIPTTPSRPSRTRLPNRPDQIILRSSCPKKLSVRWGAESNLFTVAYSLNLKLNKLTSSSIFTDFFTYRFGLLYLQSGPAKSQKQ